ncbi:MAG TPA: glycosyltransferase family 4 protein [Solirubrobacteraceae bacterium]
MKVLVASTFVPFVQGGSRTIASDLVTALRERGHEVDTIEIPTTSRWDEVLAETLSIRLLEVGEDAEVLIATRPPSYVLRHPNKRLWFIHHHRAAYDLWGTPWQDFPSRADGMAVRDAIHRSDAQYLREARKIFTLSRTVATRLREYNGIEATVLYPPLADAGRLYCETGEDYVFYPSRITSHKRQMLAIEAASHLRSDARIIIAGAPGEPGDIPPLEQLIRERGLEQRVKLIPHWISEEEKTELIARSLGVLYVPYDEDAIGYVTLEASHASKPVITCTDSGGALELVLDGENGLVVEPQGPAIAAAIDRLRADPAWAAGMGERAHELLAERRISWDEVVEALIS